MKKSAVWLGLLLPMGASADPRVDKYDASLQPVFSFSPQGEENQIPQDIEVNNFESIFVALSDPEIVANECANDAVRRIQQTFPNSVPGFVAENVRGIRGIGVNPATSMLWVAGSADCGPLVGDQIFRFQNGGSASGTSLVAANSLGDVEYAPSGHLIVQSSTDWFNYDDSFDVDVLSTVAFAPTLPLDPVYNAVSGTFFHTAYDTGVGTNFLRETTQLGATIASTSLGNFGLTADDDVRLFVRSDGRVAFAHMDTGRFEMQVDTLNAAESAVESTETLILNRREVNAVTTDSAGALYAASYGARPIDDLSVDLFPVTAGAPSQLMVTWETQHDVGPDAVFELALSDGLDLSGITDLSLTPLGTIDGSFTFSLTPATNGDPAVLQMVRTGGFNRRAGEVVGFRIVDIVNPLVETPIAIEDFRVFEQVDIPSPQPMLSALRGDLSPLNAGAAVPDIECEVGQPHDWDGLPGNEICLSPTATADPTADLQPGCQIGDGVVVGAAATVGERTIVRANARVELNSTIGEDVDVGMDTVLSRWSTVGPRVVLDDDVVIGRSATIGSDVFLPSFSVLGYASTLGNHATFGAPLTLGSFAELGGEAAEGPVINCVGALTVATRAVIATNLGFGLQCEGSAVIGPRVTIGGDSVLGDGTRVRKEGNIGFEFTTSENTQISREVNIGDGVTIQPGYSVGVRAGLCSYSDVNFNVPRDYSPSCR